LDDGYATKRDDTFPSKPRDEYKRGARDDYKREVEIQPRHSSSNAYVGSSNRIDSTTTLSKDQRYQERSSDYRSSGSSSRNDDARNGSSSKRYIETPAETRYSSSAATSNAWNNSSSHAPFSGLASSEIWAGKQPDATNTGGWRGVLDDTRYDTRFSDRKPVVPSSQFMDPSVRSNQGFMGNTGIGSINPSVGAPRYSGGGRYDNGRF